MSSGYRLVIRKPGGPEAIEREDFTALPEPGPGEVRVRNTAIGLNFIDIYHRSGLYPLPLPAGLGREAAGIVDALGAEVDGISVGDRVGYLFAAGGSYATHSIAPAGSLIRLPDHVSDEMAAASLLKGLTSWMLIEKCARAAPGQTVLVHAAAGGVGSIAVQWLKAIGANVIAHVGNAEKAARATALGADHVLHCPISDLAGEVRRVTKGAGVSAVLDGVGKDSWQSSLDSIARRGIMITFGNASGPPPAVTPLELSQRGSLSLTRPGLADFVIDPVERQQGADALFRLLGSGAVRIEIGQKFALADAVDAHRALEARQTTGSTILLP